MTASAGALLGLVIAVGLLLLITGVLANRRPRLVDRLAMRQRRPTTSERGPLSVLLEIVGPTLAAFLSRWSAEAESADRLRIRLSKAGFPDDVSRHRLEQILWSAAGIGSAGIVLLLVLAGRGGIDPIAALAILGIGGIGALLLHDRRLSAAARRRADRMDQQLPNTAELLAFAVAAGESPVAALERVGATTTGDLAGELQEVTADVRGGTGLLPALQAMAGRSPSPAVARFVEGIVVATQRGTPMAEVLRAQAADARAAGHRRLMESSSKREVLMLTPVVFLVLPIVVVIALFPGIHGLSLTVP